MQKIKVAVLMGGKSQECEVSFNSGRTVCDHLDRTRFEVIPIFQRQSGELFILPLRFLYRGKISDFDQRLAQEAELISWSDLKSLVDFVYLALHGRFGEDGTVQGMLEILGIPYLGSKVLASALSMDKIKQKQLLRTHNIRVAREVIVPSSQITPDAIPIIVENINRAEISFPCIVKPHKEGSSLGVSAVLQPDMLYQALHTAAHVHTQPQDVMIEEKIEGMEFTCIILFDRDNKPIFLPPTEIVLEAGTSIYDYTQKYMPGRVTKFTPARCSQEDIENIQSTCLKTTQVLNIETISRIDGFLTKNKEVVIIDPNTLTGMGPSSALFTQAACIGMNHQQLINHLITTELIRYNIQG